MTSEKDVRFSQFLRHLLSERPAESELLEFKANARKQEWEKIGKTISALSNSAALAKESCAHIIFGLEDKTRRVVGTVFSPDLTLYKGQHVQHYLMQKIYPPLHLEYRSFTYREEDGTDTGRSVVILEVPAATYIPVSYDHVRYIRNGATTTALERFPEHERKLWLILSKKDLVLQRAASGLTSERLKEHIDIDAYPRLLSLKPVPSEEELLTLLEKERFIEKYLGEFAITNLGALMLGRELTIFEGLKNCIIRVAVYEGTTKTGANRELRLNAGYAVGFRQALEKLTELMPHWEDIDPDGIRRVRPRAVPGIVIREVLANCMIHQDLSADTPILIEVFTDRIEFTSAGRPAIDPLRFIDALSQSDNEQIADFLLRCGMCERKGTGLDKAEEALEAIHSTAMRFDALPEATRIVVPFLKTFGEMSSAEKLRSCVMHCALRYVNYQPMTNTSLRERFGLPDSQVQTVSQLLRLALKERLIQQIPSTSRRNSAYIPVWGDPAMVQLA